MGLGDYDYRDRAVLEVIDRDHETADQFTLSRLLALALVYERKGRFYLTLKGKRALRMDGG